DGEQLRGPYRGAVRYWRARVHGRRAGRHHRWRGALHTRPSVADVAPHRSRSTTLRSHMERADHWNRVYTTKTEKDVSWFEPLPALSIEMLEAAGLTADSCVLDVGGGDSHLVDALAARGLDC